MSQFYDYFAVRKYIETFSVQKVLNASAKSFSQGQPAHSAQADPSRSFLAVTFGTPRSILRSSLRCMPPQ